MFQTEFTFTLPKGYVDRDGKKVKSCIDCTFVHLPENYDIVMELIRKKNQ